VPLEDRADDFTLNADAPAMNNPDFRVSALHRLEQVFLDQNCDFARLERVEVDRIADRNLVHSIQYNDLLFMKFYVRTYGCQMNVADSDEMGRHLRAHGLVETQDPDEASVLLVNTCTVRQHAEDRAFSEIGRLRRWKVRLPGRKLVVTGCAAERTKEYLEDRFPFVDLVIGAKSIEDFGQIAQRLLERRETDEALDYAVPAAGDKVSAFVTIMRGCNYSCTYCIVPYVRGREIYHSLDQIIGETAGRVREGAREITLLGQTVNSYRHGQHRFADLLQAVSRVEGVERVRFISPHPYYMSDRVIETMAAVPQVCESLHLPVQSGSNTMLKAMARNYTRDQYVELIGKLRRAMPGMTLSTDIIVGFPGETEDDFRQTLSMIEELQFNWGFIFKYSAREGTPAADFESWPQEVIEERHQRCLELLDRIAIQKRSALLATIQDVLIEEENFGRTRTNYRVYVDGDFEPGELVRARITNTQRATLQGELHNGHTAFANFREEDSRGSARA
jgi:tRNA-2-methylthio-N6-dimethylallyladenosine synthase